MCRRPAVDTIREACGAAPQTSTPFARGGHGRYTLLPRLATEDTTVIDLDAAIDRIHQLDEEHLEDLSRQLDGAVAASRTGPIDEDMQNVVSLAGAARILLRQRRAVAARNHAKAIVRNLIGTEDE